MTEQIIDQDNELTVTAFVGLEKLTKDLKAAAKTLKKDKARYLVDLYYQIQKNRIRSDIQTRSETDKTAPKNELLSWVSKNFQVFENNIKSALNTFTLEYRVGEWCQSICGIGPVITAGLLAHIDITKAATYGGIWRYAGLDATQSWETGQKRPWNSRLKTLCVFKLGESFVKVQNRENDYYGKIFVRRKARENEKNLNGDYSIQCKAQLGDKDAIAYCHQIMKYPIKAKNFGDDAATRIWLEGRVTRLAAEEFQLLDAAQKIPFLKKQLVNPIDSGVRMLSPLQIHARSRRYAVKLFLAHLHHVLFEDYFDKKPMIPYPFEKLNHDINHYLPPPNWPLDHGNGKKLKEMDV